MDNEINDYIKNGITINGNPIDGYTVFTIPTQEFKIDSLHQLVPQTFNDVIKEKNENKKSLDKLWLKCFEQNQTIFKEDFIKKLLNDDEFYEKWGENSCIELTYEERYKYWFSNNYETGMEYYPQNIPDFDNDYYEPTPKRKLK